VLKKKVELERGPGVIQRKVEEKKKGFEEAEAEGGVE